MTKELKERVLEDDYPVKVGFLYVADDKVIESDITGTVMELKMLLKVKEIKNCDIGGRDLWDLYKPLIVRSRWA